ncbi:hypothetical protein Hypma_002007 [Hypsizygus marmoreus]|uniref:Reverse transcriptase domain-containing protein n=1 Tax=Hypsizygus marmoreus TaxID=39966 RepID=A0A369JBV9_HYPMA|nr:hypothetical protein Hypma_002007 [Hypsizygus marmoreus]
METKPRRDAKSTSTFSRGTKRKSLHERLATLPPNELGNSSNSSPPISRSPSNQSGSLTPPRQDSRPPNGKTSSEENLSTSTSSSALSTTLELLRRTLDASDELRSAWEEQNRAEKLRLAATGLRRGTRQSKQLNSRFHTEKTNCGITPNTLKVSSPPESSHRTGQSSYSTARFETTSVVDNAASLPITTFSTASSPRLPCPTDSKHKVWLREPLPLPQLRRTPSAIASTLPPAPTTLPFADSDMSASFAENPLMGKQRAKSRAEQIHGLRPNYLRYNLWNVDASFSSNTSDWTERAKPLPSVPIDELLNPITSQTITQNPHLFRIVTPINVDVFESLLHDHPNPTFIASVCRGLRRGFWPWANTHVGEYPDTNNASLGPPDNVDEAAFIRSQCDIEIRKGRFSEPFGPHLLPGMYAMPVHAVPKPGSTDLRMVMNQSAGKHSLNSMIRREDIAGFPLDNMRHLGEMLLSIRKTSNCPLTLWKLDVAEAYRLMPLHFHFQIKQANIVDGLCVLDQNNAFGGRGSQGIWISFNGLVTWIASRKELIEFLGVYSDDSFGINDDSDLTYYHRYNKLLPTGQFKLLSLWDKLGIPHKEKKQVSGAPLVIIGIEVDPNAMTLTLPSDSRAKLIDELNTFIAQKGRKSVRFELNVWQRLAGYINWSFNVFPLLKPCLNNIYPKLSFSGSPSPTKRIWVNQAIRDDLIWARDHLENASGIQLIRALDWSPDEADFTIYCDACLDGMAFWYPEFKLAFFSPVPADTPSDLIFFYEALCVVSALHHVAATRSSIFRIIIFTDNSNTVDIFNSFHTKPIYNPLLKFVADILIDSEHQLRVLHVSGSSNTVADALSRAKFLDAITLVPNLVIKPFTPPAQLLGLDDDEEEPRDDFRDLSPQPPRLPLGAPKK